MGYANIIQRLACEAFPNADLFPFAVADGGAVEQAVKAGTTGNKLFEAVFAELDDLTDDDRDEALRRLFKAAETIGTIAAKLTLDTSGGLAEIKKQWLVSHGYFVGKRDPRLNTNYPGAYMVTEADYQEHDLPTEDGRDLFCVVGDDLDAIVFHAYDSLVV